MEGDPERARLAEAHLAAWSPTSRSINTSFETALDRVLPGLADGIDLVFIDGDKTPGSYLALLDRLSPRLNPGALVLFDDIQWTRRAGRLAEVRARPGLSFAVNAGRFGVCVWDPKATQPQAFALYGVGGVDLYQLRRDLMAKRPLAK